MAVDVTTLTDEQVMEMAQKEADRIGSYKVTNIRKLPHPADYYLRYVMCHNESKEEYAVWMFNVQMGGFHYGHYFNYGTWCDTKQADAKDKAMRDFFER